MRSWNFEQQEYYTDEDELQRETDWILKKEAKQEVESWKFARNEKS